MVLTMRRLPMIGIPRGRRPRAESRRKGRDVKKTIKDLAKAERDDAATAEPIGVGKAPLFGAGRRIPLCIQMRSEIIVACGALCRRRGLPRSRLIEALVVEEAARVKAEAALSY